MKPPRPPGDTTACVAELVVVRDRYARVIHEKEEDGRPIEVTCLNGLAAGRAVLRHYRLSFDDVADLADQEGVLPFLAAAFPSEGLARSLRQHPTATEGGT